MRTTRLGPLDARITGGEDREGGGSGPVVVLLHGFGAPGDDLVPLWRTVDVPSAIRWVFPVAPLELPSMGFGMESRAWWMLDLVARERAIARGEERDMSEDHPEGLDEARGAVLELLDALPGEIGAGPLILGGFSQGAMLALDVSLHTDRALAGLVQLSGSVVCEDEWKPRLGARAGLPVLQSHGHADPLLSFALAQRLHDLLVGAGLDAELVAFRGGHEIAPVVIERLEGFLRSLAE